MIVVVRFQLLFLNNTNYSACRDLLPNRPFGLWRWWHWWQLCLLIFASIWSAHHEMELLPGMMSLNLSLSLFLPYQRGEIRCEIAVHAFPNLPDRLDLHLQKDHRVLKQSTCSNINKHLSSTNPICGCLCYICFIFYKFKTNLILSFLF